MKEYRVAAVKKQNERRRQLPKIPVIIMTADEHAVFERVSKLFPTKKATVIAGLKKLDESSDDL